jgi:hypothetical protein
LAITASAQTADDKVLAQGNPALTQNMVEKSRGVFEFAFGGVLTDRKISLSKRADKAMAK